MANSSMLALPSITAPAALSRAHDRGIVGRDEVVEHARPAAGADPVGAENVFMNEGDAEQRAALAGGEPDGRRRPRSQAPARP